MTSAINIKTASNPMENRFDAFHHFELTTMQHALEQYAFTLRTMNGTHRHAQDEKHIVELLEYVKVAVGTIESEWREKSR